MPASVVFGQCTIVADSSSRQWLLSAASAASVTSAFRMQISFRCLQPTASAASPTSTGTVIWFAIPYIPDYHTKRSPLSLDQPALVTDDALAIESDKVGAICSAMAPHAGILCERKLTAMVIDDTMTVRKLMEKLLLRMGFARVDCYENGSKGLDAMMAGQVDIVFSDVQMPIMTGPEVRFTSSKAAPKVSSHISSRT